MVGSEKRSPSPSFLRRSPREQRRKSGKQISLRVNQEVRTITHTLTHLNAIIFPCRVNRLYSGCHLERSVL